MKATLAIFVSALVLNCILAVTARAEEPTNLKIKTAITQAQADQVAAEQALKLVLAQIENN